MNAPVKTPPAFNWEAWYDSVGGRSIRIEKADELLNEIREGQYPRFDGPVAKEKRIFVNEKEASLLIKEKARELGADEAGIALIEPSDIYRGRIIEEKFAIVVGQKMLWR